LRLYEGMYIVTMDLASRGWEEVEKAVTGTITRFGGEIVRIRKWAERTFAYPIKKRERGVYVLVQFNADPSVIDSIKERIELEEDLLRALIIRMDERYAEESFAKEPGDTESPGEEVEAAAPVEAADESGEESEEEGGGEGAEGAENGGEAAESPEEESAPEDAGGGDAPGEEPGKEAGTPDEGT